MNYFSKLILGIIVIGTALSVLQQFTGINAVLYYGADIFEKALGFGKEDILVQQILLAFVNLIFTFVAMFTVDKFGRKPLLYIGSIGMISWFFITRNYFTAAICWVLIIIRRVNFHSLICTIYGACCLGIAFRNVSK